MDLQSLNIFVQVAELSSFTKAGEVLGYSQPTVSFQIKQLEKELGVQLFDRIGHTISLTAAGRDALGYAQQILMMSQEMLSGESGRKEISGVVRVAMADSLCTPLIAEKFSYFIKKYPKVQLNIKTAGTGDLYNLLDRNEVDIVCTLDSPIHNAVYKLVNEEEIGVHFVASVNNELAGKTDITVEELLSQPFMLTEKGMSYRRLLDENLAKYSVELNPVLEMASADILSRLVEENIAISFLPDYVTQQAVDGGKIVRLNVKDFDLKVWKQIMYHRDKWVSLPMKAVMELLSDISIK